MPFSVYASGKALLRAAKNQLTAGSVLAMFL